MRKVMFLLLVLSLTSCGYSQRDAEATGQAKKVTLRTNLICPNYHSFDISLGVLKGGTGSMSTQDIWLQVVNEKDLATIKKAVETSAIVKVTYDTRRLPFCTDDFLMTSVEIVTN